MKTIREAIQDYSVHILSRALQWDGVRNLEADQGNIEVIQKICSLALFYAREYEKEDGDSLIARVETYTTLSVALQSLADRIRHSKSLLERTFGWGFSADEKELQITIQSLKNLQEPYQKFQERITLGDYFHDDLADRTRPSRPLLKRLFGWSSSADEKELQMTIRSLKDLNEASQRVQKIFGFGDDFYLWTWNRIRPLSRTGIPIKLLYKILCRISRNSAEKKICQCCFRLFRKPNIDTIHALYRNNIVGSNFAWTIKSIRKDLKEFRSTVSPEELPYLDKVISHLKEAGESATEMDFILFMERGGGQFPCWFEKCGNHELYARERRKNLAYRWEQSIGKLKPGESIIIPGGFQYDGLGHAVMYKISCYSNRLGERRYRFKIFNTGEGADLGYSRCYESLSLHTLTDPHFLHSMVGFFSSNEVDNMHFVLEFIDCYFVRNGADQILDVPPSMQTWRTCTYDSVLLWLLEELPDSILSKFQGFSTQRARAQLQEILPIIEGRYDQDMIRRFRRIGSGEVWV